MTVDGDTAYVTDGCRRLQVKADGKRGLCVLDVSEPADPTELGCCKTSGRVRGLAVSGRNAYVAAESGGLRMVDLSDPARPTEVGHYETPGKAWGVYVSGGLVYVADGSGGLLILRRAGAADDSRGEDVTS